MKWLEETVGGLENMEALNQKKSGHLYDFMDAGNFYQATAQADSRSLMNVTFRLPNEELEKQFVRDALDQGLGGLKGHRSVGGCRASIYNATTVDAVESLVDFMKYFETKNG
jgi:phosphoserine aminotransferase